jgi:hypothetical protein
VKVAHLFGIIALGLCAVALPDAGNAAPILGTPSSNPSFSPNSTNELNYNKLVPGREGQTAPYVEQISGGPGTIELLFSNLGPGLAFFERRINNMPAGSTTHPVVPSDTIHPGTSVASGNTQTVLFNIASGGILDIRLALGGERDWDFDWTSFQVAPVPLPASLPLLLAGLGALGVVTRRRRG